MEICDSTNEESLEDLKKKFEEKYNKSDSQSSPTLAPGYAESLTDTGNAERFAQQHKGKVRYCFDWGKWLSWDGKRWAMDREGTIRQLAKETVVSIYGEAAQVTGTDSDSQNKRFEISAHAKRSFAENKIKSMISLAQSEKPIPILPETLDKDKWILNVENGALDLRTGQLRPHSQSDYITKLAPVTYDAYAECPTFKKFLHKIFDGNDNLIKFIQKAIGYSLTGDTSERCLFILYGTGKNGKSTLLEVIRTLLGEYAQRTPTETLMMRRGDSGIPNDVAKLKGARFVSASESEEGQRLAESKIKDLTGQDTITARFMRAEWFEFVPEFKIWLCTNHKPTIRGTDAAIWDRIRLIPFEVRIPENEQDPNLLDKLKVESAGILRWAVEGCLTWQRERLRCPDEVVNAVADYKAESDIVGQFLSECCLLEPEEKVQVGVLHKAYVKWCEINGEKALSRKKLSPLIEQHGYKKKVMGASKTYWLDLGIISEEQEMEELVNERY